MLAAKLSAPRPAGYRPRLEWLEDRLAPAAVTSDFFVTAPPTFTGTEFVGSTGNTVFGPLVVNSLNLQTWQNLGPNLLGVTTGVPSTGYLQLVMAQNPAAAANLSQGSPFIAATPVLAPQTVIRMPAAPSPTYIAIANAPFAGQGPARILPVSVNAPITFGTPVQSGVGTLPAGVSTTPMNPTLPPSGGSAAISGVVFEDANGDRQHQAAEPGVGDVKVTLEIQDGKQFIPVTSTFTDSKGHYVFDYLPPATYRIVIETPQGQQTAKPVEVGATTRATGQNFSLPPKKQQSELPTPPPAVIDGAFAAALAAALIPEFKVKRPDEWER